MLLEALIAARLYKGGRDLGAEGTTQGRGCMVDTLSVAWKKVYGKVLE